MNKNLLHLFIFVIFFLGFPVFSQEVLEYDYSDTYFIPIKLQPLQEISTKEGLIEGSEVNLKVKKDVYYKNKLIVKKNSIVTAKIETYITKGMNGFPAEIILDSFKIDGIKESQLLCTYTKAGKNFAPLVYPIKWALTPIPFVGSVTNLITGTNATIRTDDEIVIKYFPNWK